MRTLSWILLVFGALLLLALAVGCGGGRVARLAEPHHETVSAGEYAAAEDAFAGEPPPAEASASEMEELWTAQRCQDTLDRRDALVAVTAGMGGLAGAGGLATVIPEDASRDMRLGFGITTVILAAATSAMTVAIKSLSDRFEMWCNTAPPPTMVPMTPVPAPRAAPPPVPEPEEARDAGVE